MLEPRHTSETGRANGRAGQVQRNGSYGIDAPYLLPILGVLLAANVVQGVVTESVWPFVGASVVLACAICGLYTSRRGKFVAWTELLDQLNLRGDEAHLGFGLRTWCGVAARRPASDDW